MNTALVKLNTQKLSTGIGWISLGIGTTLALAPRGSAGFLGWGSPERSARFIGAADLVIGAGLLLAPRRSRWMLARALLNVVIALIYAQAMVDGAPRRKRLVGGVCLMTGLTVNDYLISRYLRETEASYNLLGIR